MDNRNISMITLFLCYQLKIGSGNGAGLSLGARGAQLRVTANECDVRQSRRQQNRRSQRERP